MLRITLGGIFAATLIFAATHCVTGQVVNRSNGSVPGQTKVTNMQKLAEELVSETLAGDLLISVDMKESVDFLLTPALLVQEAISDEIMITYPTQ